MILKHLIVLTITGCSLSCCFTALVILLATLELSFRIRRESIIMKASRCMWLHDDLELLRLLH